MLSEPKIEVDPNMHPIRILDKLCMKTKKPAQVYAYTETELGFNVRVGLEKHRATGEGRNKKKHAKKNAIVSGHSSSWLITFQRHTKQP